MTTTVSSALLDALKATLVRRLKPHLDDPIIESVLDAMDDTVEQFGAQVVGGNAGQPVPFAVDSTVSLVGQRDDGGTYGGVVVKRLEDEGQLHTVGVRWAPGGSIELYSPAELVEVP